MPVGTLGRLFGWGLDRTGHLEKWLSVAGGLAGLLAVMLISQAELGLGGSASLVASMGASAVLLFAVPHGPLSQPWPVFGGHLVSACIGVACAKLAVQPLLTAAAAVALAIGAMHYLRCMHPPGGATALTAVVGGDAVHSLGFHFVVTPVLLNVLTILLVALLFNYPFPWRRYPAHWARVDRRATAPAAEPGAVFSRDDLAAAVTATGMALNIGADEMQTLCTLASCNSECAAMRPNQIANGRYYCNGTFGSGWQVRRVNSINGAGPGQPASGGIVTYTVVAGHQRRRTATATRDGFARWASYEVLRNENCWQRTQPVSATREDGDAA
jgi:hypothetical protein